MLDKVQWAPFCAGVAHQLEGEEAEIEVAALGLGDQIQSEWASFIGVTYDPKDDLFDVAVEGLDRLIDHPSSFVVSMEGPLVESMTITSASGEQNIIRFREPLLLPGGEGAAQR
jgi:hypothetical protein